MSRNPGIKCRGCGKYHHIIPLSHKEVTLYRAMLAGESRKSYFCQRSCYDRYMKYVRTGVVDDDIQEEEEVRVSEDINQEQVDDSRRKSSV